MKEFLFNECGCCTNPNIFFDIKSLLPNFKRKLIIETGYSVELGMWDAGYSYLFGSSCGGGRCVSFTNTYNRRIFFKTEKAAAIEKINFFIDGQDTPQAAKEVLKDYLNTLLHEQLSLF